MTDENPGPPRCTHCGSVLPAHCFECPLWTWPTPAKALAWSLVAGVILAMLFGCAGPSLPADPSGMTAEQIKALAGDKNATVSCATFDSLVYGTVTTVLVVFDKSAFASGSIAVHDGCRVLLRSTPKE